MQLERLVLENFRACERLELEYGRRITLMLGSNGSGKTSILDGTAVGLGAMLTHLPSVSGLSFRKSGDIRQQQNKLAPYTRVSLASRSGVQWDRLQRRDKSRATAGALPAAMGVKGLERFLDQTVIDPLNAGAEYVLPIVAYYGVSRAVLEVPLRRKGFPKSHHRMEALDGALNANSSFKSAFIWFYNKESEEHRLQKEQRSFDAYLPELEAVRRAISLVFPDITNPHIEVNPLRLAVTLNGETLDLMQLSDGYKTLLGLVIDLSIRMGLANAHLEDPLSAEAVVMIDEVDLHLHPSWQRRVIADLLRTFSNTQFIVTTHSPFIVEALNNHLQRSKIGTEPTGDPEIDSLIPLAIEDVRAYVMENSQKLSIVDQESGLLDDSLLAHFNEINVVYDRMRDIEWSARYDRR